MKTCYVMDRKGNSRIKTNTVKRRKSTFYNFQTVTFYYGQKTTKLLCFVVKNKICYRDHLIQLKISVNIFSMHTGEKYYEAKKYEKENYEEENT